jgi:hypothetical protein
MRNNSKLTLVCLLGILALSAITAASASAATCTVKEGSKHYQLCINGTAATGTITAEGTSAAPLNLNLEKWDGESGYLTSLECTTSTAGGAASLSVGATNVSIRTEPKTNGCSLHGSKAGVEKCHAKTERFNSIEGTFTSLENLAFENSKASFWEWQITGSECNQKTEMAMNGSYNCTMSEPKVEAVSHELTCASKTIDDVWRPSSPTPLTYKQKISLAGTQKGEKFSFYEAT